MAWFANQFPYSCVLCTKKKKRRKKHRWTVQHRNSRNCFNSFYSWYTGLWSEKMTKLVVHMLKNTFTPFVYKFRLIMKRFYLKKDFCEKNIKNTPLFSISVPMIINKIVLIVHWSYWLFTHILKFYWIYCSLKWMPNHAIEYSFDVIEFTLRANESCLEEFEFRKTLMRVLKLYWMFTIMQISLLKLHFAQLNADWRKWTYFRIIVWLLMQMIACFP